MAYATEAASSQFLEVLRAGFADAERAAVYMRSTPDVFASARDAADAAFSALPLPPALAQNADVRRALADMHTAHLALLNEIATRDPAKSAREDEHTRRVRVAQARYTTASAAADRVVAPRNKAYDSDIAQLAEAVFQPDVTGDGAWQRADIAEAAARGDYSTAFELVLKEASHVVEVRRAAAGDDAARDSVRGKALVPRNKRAADVRRGGRDAALAALRRGLVRGPDVAIAAARLAAPLDAMHHGRWRRARTVRAGARDDELTKWQPAAWSVYRGYKTVTQATSAFARLLQRLVGREQTKLKRLEARHDELRSRQKMLRPGTKSLQERADLVFQFLEDDIEARLDEVGIYESLALDKELRLTDLATAERRFATFDDIRKRGDGSALARASEIVAAYGRVLIQSRRTLTTEIVGQLRRMGPLPEQLSFANRLDAILDREKLDSLLVMPIARVDDDSDNRATGDIDEAAINNALRNGTAPAALPPGFAEVLRANEDVMVVRSDDNTRVYISTDNPAEAEYHYDVTRDDSGSVLVEPFVANSIELQQVPALDALANWRAGMRGPLAPIEIELFFTRTDLVPEADRVARFVALREYAESVGVLDRETLQSGLGTRVDDVFDTRPTFRDAWRAAIERTVDLGSEFTVEELDIDGLAAELGRATESDSVDAETIALGDALPPSVPAPDSRLRKRILVAIDAYLSAARRTNLDARYRFGDALSYMLTDGSLLDDTPELDELALDPELSERTRSALAAASTEPLQIAQLASLRSGAAPAAESFRALVAAGDAAQYGETKIVVRRRVDGAAFDERLAGRVIDLEFSTPDDAQIPSLPADEEAALRVLQRSGKAVSKRTVRIDQRVACADDSAATCRQLFVTDTLVHLDPQRASRVQIVQRDTNQVLTVRIAEPLGDGKFATALLGSVAVGAPIATGAIAGAIDAAESAAAARYTVSAGDDERRALDEMLTFYRATVGGDEPGGIAGVVQRAFDKALRDPVGNIGDMLTQFNVLFNPSSSVAYAHSIAIANLQYLLDLFGLARAAGGLVLRVLPRIGFIERRWREARDALLGALGSLQQYFVGNMLATALRWLTELAREKLESAAQWTAAYAAKFDKQLGELRVEIARELRKRPVGGGTESDGVWARFKSFVASYMPTAYQAAAFATLLSLRVAAGVATRMLGAFAAVFAAESPDGADSWLSGGVKRVAQLAVTVLLGRIVPLILANFGTFVGTFIYASIASYITRKALNGVRTLAKEYAGLRAPAATVVALGALSAATLLPWLGGVEYRVIGVLNPVISRVSQRLVDPVRSSLPNAAAPDQQAQLVVFAARAAARILFPQLLDTLLHGSAVGRDYKVPDIPEEAGVVAADGKIGVIGRDEVARVLRALVIYRGFGKAELRSEEGVDYLLDYSELARVARNFIDVVDKRRNVVAAGLADAEVGEQDAEVLDVLDALLDNDATALAALLSDVDTDEDGGLILEIAGALG